MPPKNDSIGVAEIYLFDTASGGAGYAFDAGENLDEVLDAVEGVLSNCAGHCERSCTKCLRHYGNRFFHPRLDRRLGLQLLHYARSGVAPAIHSSIKQAECLEPLSRFLALEGWKVSKIVKHGNVVAPLVAQPQGGSVVFIGTHPALLSPSEVDKHHELRKESKKARVVLLPDYLVEQDLPSAYQEFIRQAEGVKGQPAG